MCILKIRRGCSFELCVLCIYVVSITVYFHCVLCRSVQPQREHTTTVTLKIIILTKVER
jgi:hypothetical protein